MAAGTDMYVTFAGGLPITVDGHCVGGVGVSGGTGEQDAEVARAGIGALSTQESWRPAIHPLPT